ncbi:MAG TPA: hypothetical protein VND64_27290 [Pirellulales bacterium]|nr:hypothetical protein [Pirellulales bacterium]
MKRIRRLPIAPRLPATAAAGVAYGVPPETFDWQLAAEGFPPNADGDPPRAEQDVRPAPPPVGSALPANATDAGRIVVMAEVADTMWFGGQCPRCDWECTPRYDGNNRTLTLRGVVILSLSPQAKNLHAVLMALQAAGWAPWVSLPLNDRPGGYSAQRLYDAVSGLNNHAGQLYVDFHSEGNGVHWNYRDPVGPYAPRQISLPRTIGVRRKTREKSGRKPR